MNVRFLEVRLRDLHRDPIFLDASELQDVDACPACRSQSTQRALAIAQGRNKQSLQLGQCGKCDHVYLQRRPSVEWFDRYYSQDWDTGSWWQNALKTSGRSRRLIRRSRVATQAVRAARVLRRDLKAVVYPGPARLLGMLAGLGDAQGDEFPQGKKLLEIGTGYGGSLLFLRDFGLDTYGTEANVHRAAACRAQGLRVFQTTADDFGPLTPHAPFDFVFSSHVFEHLVDLDRMMKALEPLVSYDGFIYLVVPHGPVAEDVIIRAHVPVHCHVFSVSSLSALLRRYGFQPIRVQADVGLHIVAQKSQPSVALGHMQIPARPDSMVHGLDVVADEKEPLLIRYDQYLVEIRRASDGTLLYSRTFPYGVHRSATPNFDEFIVQIHPESNGESLPFHFQHPTDQAPIWMKYG